MVDFLTREDLVGLYERCWGSGVDSATRPTEFERLYNALESSVSSKDVTVKGPSSGSLAVYILAQRLAQKRPAIVQLLHASQQGRCYLLDRRGVSYLPIDKARRGSGFDLLRSESIRLIAHKAHIWAILRDPVPGYSTSRLAWRILHIIDGDKYELESMDLYNPGSSRDDELT